MTIVVNLDVVLAERKMRLGAVAERIGITVQNLSNLKTGKAKAIRFTTLAKLCAVLDCQPGDLLVYDAGEAAEGETGGSEAHAVSGSGARHAASGSGAARAASGSGAAHAASGSGAAGADTGRAGVEVENGTRASEIRPGKADAR